MAAECRRYGKRTPPPRNARQLHLTGATSSRPAALASSGKPSGDETSSLQSKCNAFEDGRLIAAPTEEAGHFHIIVGADIIRPKVAGLLCSYAPRNDDDM